MSEEYQNMKKAIDGILGVNSIIKRKRKTEVKKNKDMFIQAIHRLEESIVKSNIAFFDLGLDMTKYDESYLEVIDMMLFLLYGKDCYEVISFYLYERTDMETGKINPIIIQETGEEVFLENADELYEILKKINPKIP